MGMGMGNGNQGVSPVGYILIYSVCIVQILGHSHLYAFFLIISRAYTVTLHRNRSITHTKSLNKHLGIACRATRVCPAKAPAEGISSVLVVSLTTIQHA